MEQAGQATLLQELRTQVARRERRGAIPGAAVLPFGIPPLDAAVPEGGLARGALHEAFGAGVDVGRGAAAALLVAGRP
jgi:protein ImuA